jgi:tetratricopeptide (TPR) repeat protein
MKLIYAAFVLLSVFLTSAQCQQTAEDWVKKGNAFQSQGKYDEAIKAYDEAIRLVRHNINFAIFDNAFGVCLWHFPF